MACSRRSRQGPTHEGAWVGYQWAAQCVADKNLFYRYASLSYTMGCGRRGRGWGFMLDWTSAIGVAEGIAVAWRGAPGGAFVLFDRDGIRAAACGGLASLEHGIPFTPDTPSRYASISKHFLAATLLLEDIPLDATLGALLPGLHPALASVTLGRALDMTGGLPDMMEVLWQQGLPFTGTISREEISSVLGRLDATCSAPGAEMAYSNTGWRLGQAVLAERGIVYQQALRRRLLDPLGLSIAFPYDETEVVPGLATGYWREGNAWRRGRYGLHFSPSGGLAGSAAALAHWAGALMAGRGPLDGMLEQLLAPRYFANGQPSSYRLGLVETRLGDTRLVAHSGSLPGHRNHLLMAPDLGVGVVLLLNRDEDPLMPALRVMAALVGEAPPQPAPDLPSGLFAAEHGPAWAQMVPGAIEFMGGHEALVAAGADRVRSIPSTLDIDLCTAGGALDGHIGGVHRTLLSVPDGLVLDRSLIGTWREVNFGVELLIREDGTARWPWAGSVGRDIPLTPLPGARALAALTHAMWRHRPCLWLHTDGTLRVASHRARVLRFERG
jgi:CubicO group peptidase (beta-lactamase class C family)